VREAAPATERAIVLVIEDEPAILRFLRAALISEGYHMAEAVTGQDGLAQAAAQRPDVIVVDLGLPDVDGLEVIRHLREWSAVPIIVLSARGQEVDKIAALDLGADDYVSKPFGVGELLARLRVALRHTSASPGEETDPVIAVGPLRIDFVRRRVTMGGADVHLTPIEYRLLTTLVRHAGRVMTHRQLLDHVWGPAYAGETHYLRVYMGTLRRKLEADPTRPRYLLTEPGVGYRLAAE
jgi:two-component system, OmpR family, KDP operon response regulator KdpE